MSRSNTFPSMPFIFSGLAFVMIFATAASSLTARSASRSYPSRFSFIFCLECHACAESEEKNAHLGYLAYLLRDLGCGLQVLTNYRDRLHDRAKDIERRDGMIEAGHACEGGVMVKTVFAESRSGSDRGRKTLDRRSTSWAKGKLRKRCVHCLRPQPPPRSRRRLIVQVLQPETGSKDVCASSRFENSDIHELHILPLRARRTPHAPGASASVSPFLHPRCGATFSSSSGPPARVGRRRGSSRRAGPRRRDAHGRDREYRRVLRRRRQRRCRCLRGVRRRTRRARPGQR
jgi:hypothetical protein